MRSALATIIGSILAAFALLAAQSGKMAVPDSWTARRPPFKIMGNIYYVGSADLASYLITTKAGHILIDTGHQRNADAVIESIARLGFDVENVRLLLTTQAHFDHVGAHEAIRRRSRAKVLAASGDAPVMKGGGKGDHFLGPDYAFPPVRVDRLIHDGEVVTLGDTSLTARITPGHTRGTTTWTTTVLDRNGRMRHVMVMGSTAVLEGVRLVGNREYPQIASDFRRSFRVLKSLPCEVFLAAHASSFDGMRKAEAARAGQGEEVFIDPEGCRAAVERSETAFETELERQQTQRR
jgi:metallo-beta-lactamase class B